MVEENIDQQFSIKSSGKTQTIGSDAYLEHAQDSILCDGSIIDEIVEEFGVNVVVRVVTKKQGNEYNEGGEEYSDQRIPAIVQSFSESTEENAEGVFKPGEVGFSFKKEYEDIIKPGNRIKYGQTWYEISEINKQPVAGTLYYLTATVNKI